MNSPYASVFETTTMEARRKQRTSESHARWTMAIGVISAATVLAYAFYQTFQTLLLSVFARAF